MSEFNEKLRAKYAKAKARFWDAMKHDKLRNPHKLSNQEIARISGDAKIYSNLPNEEFYDWFMDKNTSHQILASGAEKAAEELVLLAHRPFHEGDRTFTAATKLTAIKTLLEATGHFKRADELPNTKTVETMTEAEVDKLLRDNGYLKSDGTTDNILANTDEDLQ